MVVDLDNLAAERILLVGDSLGCSGITHDTECIAVFLVCYRGIFTAEELEILSIVVVEKKDGFLGIGEL